MAKPTLAATVDRHGKRDIHRLYRDGVEIDRRTSATRRYTHVLAGHSSATDSFHADSWSAWSWHLSERAAYRAMGSHPGGGDRSLVQVVEVVEVPE